MATGDEDDNDDGAENDGDDVDGNGNGPLPKRNKESTCGNDTHLKNTRCSKSNQQSNLGQSHTK